jgi:hypothetical protein
MPFICYEEWYAYGMLEGELPRDSGGQRAEWFRVSPLSENKSIRKNRATMDLWR